MRAPRNPNRVARRAHPPPSEAYGHEDEDTLLDVVEARILSLYDTARERGEAGEPGWKDVWRDTRGRQWLASLEYVRHHRGGWEYQGGS
jgi:hypothetical protein